MDTQTPTVKSAVPKAVSNVKLWIAASALFGAGAIALAVMPMRSPLPATQDGGIGDISGGCTDLDSLSTSSSQQNFLNQLFIKGETRYNVNLKASISHIDYCYTFPKTSKTILMEGTCEKKGKFTVWQKNCADFNFSKPEHDYQCVNGACVNKGTGAPLISCFDSDGGNNYDAKGTVMEESKDPVFLENNYVKIYDDFCDNSGSILHEWSCVSDKKSAERIINCPNGCKDGACVKPVTSISVICTDSDGGKNYDVQGTIAFGGKHPATDYCLKDSFLYETYCENNLGKTEFIYCPKGCKDGACIKAEISLTCNDSDDNPNFAKELTTKGTCVDKFGTSTDACFDGYSVKEYSCEPTNQEPKNCNYIVHNCQSSGFKVCNNGMCY